MILRLRKAPIETALVLPWLKWRENFVDPLLLKSTIFVWILGETFISCQVYNEGCFQCPVPVESFYRERYIQASKEHEQLRKKLQSQAEQEIEQLTSQKRLLERKVNTKIITWPTRHIIENLAPVWLKPDLTDILLECWQLVLIVPGKLRNWVQCNNSRIDWARGALLDIFQFLVLAVYLKCAMP